MNDLMKPQPWRHDAISDDLEQAFDDVTAGLAAREELRELTIIAAIMQTMAHFDMLCERLAGLPISKKLRAVLDAIGREGRERLSARGVDTGDAVRCALILVYGVPADEVEPIVAVCVRYGKEAARQRLSEISRKLRDPALRLALGIHRVSLRRSARRLRVSPAALSKKVKRIRAKLRGKG